MKEFDVVIIGGGAAGLMCAIAAGRRGRRVVVLEGSNRIGKKILMSGGGRCNFTNLHCEPANFLSSNPNFCISALRRYTQWDFIALVEKHGIAYHEKTAGQLFCDQSSKQIVAMLRAECDEAGVTIVTHCADSEVQHAGRYQVSCSAGKFSGEALVIATGGLSIPKMGASDFGYRIARQFGLEVLPTRAGLVPFTFTGSMHEVTARLSGVSLSATLSNDLASFTEHILFTHRGLSGPAALQLSSYWQPGEDITANLLPPRHVEQPGDHFMSDGETDPKLPSIREDGLIDLKRTKPKSRLRAVLTEHLPRALVQELQTLWWADRADMPLADWPDAALRGVGDRLSGWSLKPAGTEGYRTAEVTLGGVDTRELSSKTMECRNQAGLYFIGEAVDVTGHLGGFNFQWAWASGHAAGQVA